MTFNYRPPSVQIPMPSISGVQLEKGRAVNRAPADFDSDTEEDNNDNRLLRR